MPTVVELNNQGNAFFDQGNFAQAAECFRQAIAIDPRNAETHNNLGIALYMQGNLAEAEGSFREAIKNLPNYANAHNNLGNVLKDQGLQAEAGACYRQALSINPHHANAHNNLGLVLYGQGDFAQAAECFLQAVRINPNYVNAYTNLGQALVSQGQHTQAVQCFRQALLLNPNHVDAHINLGNAFQEQKQWTQAADCYRQALRIAPDHADAHYNLGNTHIGLKQLGEATQCYRRALALNPDYAKAHNNLGNALKDQGLLAEAVVCYEQVLRMEPNNSEALNNMAIAYKDQGLLQKAEEGFARALALDESKKIALWNRGLLRLSKGDFENGWPDYEQRWHQPGTVPRVFKQPRWDGSALAGKTILVYAEQGLGDTLQFIRYLPMVQERGGAVIFESQPSLVGLLTDIKGAAQVLRAGDALPPFDVQIPLLSLPGLFGTTLANIPANIPYLRANPKRVQHWREALEQLTSSPLATSPSPPVTPQRPLTIGIVWCGSMTQLGDRRSVPLRQFELLANVPGVRLVSLQVGGATKDLAAAPFPILDLGSRFDPNTLEDLAGALMNLDLVVTIDTAVAHLAGALGRRAWVALAFSPDWRWLLDRQDCPWYPTLRLVRQSKLGDWGKVFERMKATLLKRVTKK